MKFKEVNLPVVKGKTRLWIVDTLSERGSGTLPHRLAHLTALDRHVLVERNHLALDFRHGDGQTHRWLVLQRGTLRSYKR